MSIKYDRFTFTAFVYLFLGVALNIFIAVYPLSPLVEGSSIFEKTFGFISLVLEESSRDATSLIAIFWIPFLVFLSFLMSLFLAFIVKMCERKGVIVYSLPLAALLAVNLYYFVSYSGIHMSIISTLLIAGIWYETRKHCKKSPA